jgi:3,4-dihydroxy 2-butanone 4-phosphate synthase/GTP cyclohydrolase II
VYRVRLYGKRAFSNEGVAKVNSTEELIEEIKKGNMVILVDDEDRENEGDIVLAADHVTSATVNFMAKEARGLICLTLTADQVSRLGLPQMVRDDLNLTPHKTAFTVSIEASKGVSTGISAADRAHTIKVASNPNANARDVITPGHIFPIKAQVGGVLKRAGHTEGSVDLAKMAGLNPAAVICEIMNEDGTMARMPDLKAFAEKHKIKIGTIVDLIKYRMAHETLVVESASASLPNKFHKDFRVRVFTSQVDGSEHIALVKGQIDPEMPTVVRVHSECLTGDTFGSLRCDCGPQLEKAIQHIANEPSGVLLYLKQEGRGIGLSNKIKAYALQENGMDTVEANLHLGFKADERDYGVGAQILKQIGVTKIKLLTNNPAKRVGLKGYGLEIVERIPLVIESNLDNEKYLEAKRIKMGHEFTGVN